MPHIRSSTRPTCLLSEVGRDRSERHRKYSIYLWISRNYPEDGRARMSAHRAVLDVTARLFTHHRPTLEALSVFRHRDDMWNHLTGRYVG